ncbi:hypothetical protein [Yersinia rohdei]|nr:hypothetical protein [Yersinia rohdei]
MLQGGALDSLVAMMGQHDFTESRAGFMSQLETDLRNNMITAWSNIIAT